MCGPHHLLAEPLELGSWDILGRGGWDATEGVLALVVSASLPMFSHYGSGGYEERPPGSKVQCLWFSRR